MRGMRDTALGLLLVAALAAALGWAGSCDRAEEGRHARWMAGMAEAGAAVML